MSTLLSIANLEAPHNMHHQSPSIHHPFIVVVNEVLIFNSVPFIPLINFQNFNRSVEVQS